MSASDHLERAMLLLQQGRYDLAEQQLRQALAQDPNHPIVHALLGICLTTRDDREGAIAACENAVSLAPDFSFTHHVFARTLNHFDRLTEAEAAVREAIRLDPEEPEYHGTLALILLNRKRWPEALTAAETGLQLNAEEVDCLNYRAIALTRLGRRDEAGQSIHTALEHDPDNAHSHANMGWTLLHAGNHRKAAFDHFRERCVSTPIWNGRDWASSNRSKHTIRFIVHCSNGRFGCQA